MQKAADVRVLAWVSPVEPPAGARDVITQKTPTACKHHYLADVEKVDFRLAFPNDYRKPKVEMPLSKEQATMWEKLPL